MMAWLSARIARRCPPFVTPAADRAWLRMRPRELVCHLPALGPVLALTHATLRTAGGRGPGQRELAALAAMHWLVRASAIDGDGPHEWIECRDAGGHLRLQLHLLPDTDYLGWEALACRAEAGSPGAGLLPGERGEPESLRVCEFYRDRRAGACGLRVIDPASLSWPGIETVRTMARVTHLPPGRCGAVERCETRSVRPRRQAAARSVALRPVWHTR